MFWFFYLLSGNILVLISLFLLTEWFHVFFYMYYLLFLDVSFTIANSYFNVLLNDNKDLSIFL